MSLNRRTLLLLALAVSVALNLFFIGAVTARFVDRPPPPREPVSMFWVMRSLDDGTRESLRPQLSQYAEVLRPLRREMFRTQAEINELLQADHVDPQAITDAFAKLRSANLSYQEVAHEQLAQVLARLTPQQRANAVRVMDERRNGDRPRSEPPRNGLPPREGGGEHNHN